MRADIAAVIGMIVLAELLMLKCIIISTVIMRAVLLFIVAQNGSKTHGFGHVLAEAFMTWRDATAQPL